jgi:dienelactone hydrolase
MKTRHLIALALLATFALHAAPKPEPRVPPAGLKIAGADRAELTRGAAELGAEIESLRRDLAARPALLELLPDVVVYHKAVDWALRYDEFYRSNEVGLARGLLKQGLERARQLRAGQVPWLTATGLVVRGYLSRVDGSVQPYGLIVPAGYDPARTHRLDIWLHGRDNNLTELKFITDRQKSPGEFTPAGALVLHPYGRYCNAFKFAGETDVFEALAHVKKNYRVDDRRIALRGFSMGGAGAWHIGAHHPGDFVAVNPGAGFVDVKNYQKLADKLGTIAPWEQRLWGLYDALDCPVNLINTTLVAYSGETDGQKAAADLMERALAREGIKMTHIIGPKTGHKYEAAAKKEVARLVDAAAARGLNAQPTNISFVTRTLKFNRVHWLTLERLEKHWDEARVDARIVPGAAGARIEISTRNVAAFGIDLVPASLIGRGARLVVDGQDLGMQNTVFSLPPPGQPGSWWKSRVKKSGGRWSGNSQSPGAITPLAKRHDLQGPIDDAFTGSFLIVRPTGGARDAQTAAWIANRLTRATNEWRAQFRGDARVKDDTAVTDEDIAAHHLVVFGDPQSNRLLARMMNGLPLKWSASEVALGGKTFGAGHVPVMIFPNPLNPARYVVLNSGFTFPEAGSGSNAQQTPKLPDYAVLDATQGGAVTHAGFFDEQWK